MDIMWDFTKSKFAVQLYNTQTRRKEFLQPIKQGEVSLYTCGPTVYAFVHIGNWRTFIFEDLLRRTLEFFGYKVTHVMNLTDVDDKTIRGANAASVSLDEYTKPFKEAFFLELKQLDILPASQYPEATHYIGEMIKIIEKLLEKNIAYQGSDGSIYYNIKKFPKYGCLSHLKLDELEAGSSQRVELDEYDKEHASDFVLWKSYHSERDGKIFWESPFGLGRPGWHIECSAMAMKILGSSIDIHAGGIDNMFPHHENEIAQSEAYSGNTFSKLWLHSEHLVVDGKKMAKSFGNFYTLKDLLAKGYTAKEVRFMLLQTHYKTQLNFTNAGLEGVKSALNRLQAFVRRLQEIEAGEESEKSFNLEPSIEKLVETCLQSFSASLADDLNISSALAALFDLVRQSNLLCDEKKMGIKQAGIVLEALKKINSVLALLDFEKKEETISQELKLFLEQRQKARADKQWHEADRLRDLIGQAGYVIEDTAQGPRLIKNI